MSHYDEKYYNIENLHEEDRHEMEYWHDMIESSIEAATVQYVDTFDNSTILGKVRQETTEEFAKVLREAVNWAFQEITVSTIDEYDEDVPEREEYTTWLTAYKD